MNDLRLALRHLLRNPGFALVAMLTLGLGIGLVTTQVSLIDGVMLRPLPFEQAARIYHVARQGQGDYTNWAPVAYDEYLAVRAPSAAVERLAGWRSETYNLAGADGMPERLWGAAVSAEFFDLLDVSPRLGRVLGAQDEGEGRPLRAVVSYAVWRDALGSDPAAIGRTIRLNGELAEVVGVMPDGFMFPSRESVWVNLRLPSAAPAGTLPMASMVEMLALLRPGVEPAAAATELEGRVRAHRAALGRSVDEAPPLRVQRIQRAYNGGGTQTLFATLLAMTGFVLLLACVNVANLLYVRAADRSRELAVRSALGAQRSRVVRQLFAESAWLAAGDALVGVLLAALGVATLQAQVTSRIDMPSWMYFDLNPRVLAATIAVAAFSGLAAGLLPALRASRVDAATVLRGEGRGSLGGGFGRTRRLLMAAQIGFAGMALVLAALLAQSAATIARGAQTYTPDQLLVGRLELQGPPYAEPAARVAFYDRLIERVRATPGVRAAAVSSRDLASSGVYDAFEVEGVVVPRERDRPWAWIEVVSRDYFALVERGPIAGRVFGPGDRLDSAPVAVVNRSFAERHFAGRDPIGQRIRRGDGSSPWATVVGVVPDLAMQGLGNSAGGEGWYLLQDQAGWGWLDLLVRVDGDPAAMVPVLRGIVAALDADQPVHSIQTLTERTARATAGMSIVSAMAVVFALAALLLAAVGVFGVVAYAARLRTREFGLRLALGARATGLVGLLLRQNGGLLLAGLVLGLGGGWALSRPLQPMLSTVPGDSLRALLVVGAVLAATALLACWLPARRAGRIDPTEALRGD